MNKQTKNITSIILATIILAACITLLPITANANPDNQNIKATVTVEPIATKVFVGEETQITITITNDQVDRGIPQVSIRVNEKQVYFYENLRKGETVTYCFDVNTNEAGDQIFDIAVWTRLGNKNFEQTLHAEKITIEVIEPPQDEQTLLEKFNGAIANGDFSGKGPIVLTVDGVDYAFTSNSGNYNGNGSLFCSVDGVVYRLERNNKGLIGVFLN